MTKASAVAVIPLALHVFVAYATSSQSPSQKVQNCQRIDQARLLRRLPYRMGVVMRPHGHLLVVYSSPPERQPHTARHRRCGLSPILPRLGETRSLWTTRAQPTSGRHRRRWSALPPPAAPRVLTVYWFTHEHHIVPSRLTQVQCANVWSHSLIDPSLRSNWLENGSRSFWDALISIQALSQPPSPNLLG